jgi:DNA-binding NarL/FixJ family response regulator
MHERTTSDCSVTFCLEEETLRKIRILVAVEQPPLGRIIELLLHSQPHYRVAKCLTEWTPLARYASRLQPELIIISINLLGDEAARIVADVKLASPGSKLILINFSHDLGRHARKWGADAYLNSENLVQHLVPKAEKLLRQEISSYPN